MCVGGGVCEWTKVAYGDMSPVFKCDILYVCCILKNMVFKSYYLGEVRFPNYFIFVY